MRRLVNVFVMASLLQNTSLLSANYIIGLDDRLKHFENCNIRITAQFETTDLQSVSVPLGLIHVDNRRNSTFFQNIWKMPINYALMLYPFKYREICCNLDLIIHLGDEKYDSEKYWHRYSTYPVLRIFWAGLITWNTLTDNISNN